MKHDPHAYTITIQKVQIDGDEYFESTITELPDASMYAESPGEAYELAIDTIETTAVMLEEAGREMPNPIAKVEDFSGRVTLRMAKSQHSQAAKLSEVDGVSLNQFIVNAVSEKIGALSVMTLYQEKIQAQLRELTIKASKADYIIITDYTENKVGSYITDSSTPSVQYSIGNH